MNQHNMILHILPGGALGYSSKHLPSEEHCYTKRSRHNPSIIVRVSELDGEIGHCLSN